MGHFPTCLAASPAGCPGDPDAGSAAEVYVDARCVPAPSLFLRAFNAGTSATVHLNVLIDMNHDGDWNDNFICGVCI